jgi:hypothetical protein
MTIETNVPQDTRFNAADDSRTPGNVQLDPEELRSIHELFAGDEDIPHEDDETSAETELSREQVKSHTDNAVEDEANSSLYQGQHLPE